LISQQQESNRISARDFRRRIHQLAPTWLEWLGVPSADLRWHRALAYMKQLHLKALGEVRDDILQLMVCEKTKANWLAREDRGAAPSRDDQASAELWCKRVFARLPRRSA